jgi:hypothetical protein
MESLSPFLWRTCTSYNMPVYPGARRFVANPSLTTNGATFRFAVIRPERDL